MVVSLVNLLPFDFGVGTFDDGFFDDGENFSGELVTLVGEVGGVTWNLAVVTCVTFGFDLSMDTVVFRVVLTVSVMSSSFTDLVGLGDFLDGLMFGER